MNSETLTVIKELDLLKKAVAKECYNSYLKRKNTKSVKRSKIITQQLQAIESPSITDIKSVILEHPKTSHKLCKTIRQAEKVSKYVLAKVPIALNIVKQKK